ncbi:sterigmatocystin 8-O-methyltransferase [Byssothecium circinans]|uniref:Sterigmatocystin 8-O-methyltransferase n=1 Tax=Byssothecium circinans TaxID=147558 RepID=A0A6A5TAA9_9PLEO|nr:sterigmatocystin 8-O-methyltransferase [Byssothecium circinans]
MSELDQITLTSLAARISELTGTITKHLKEKKLEAPTFAANSPLKFPVIEGDLFVQRQVLLDAINDLHTLIQGPSESVFNYVHTAAPDISCLNVLNFFDFWSAVPLDPSSSASFAEISQHVHLPLEVTTRILQHAFTLRLFAETHPGKLSTRVIHTSRSAALATSPGLRGLVQAVGDDASAPTIVLNEALNRYSKDKQQLPEKQEETAFALLHSGALYQGHERYFDFQESEGGWRTRSYTRFMKYLKEIFGLEELVVGVLDWEGVGEARVVDVGGSAGHDAVVLASKFPNLSVTVQDLPHVESEFNATVPEELKSRVTFHAHSFLTPQPPLNASIYLFKMILHDTSDADAILIFRALIPALKPGARVVLLEYIGNRGETETALPLTMRQWGTAVDIRLMALMNGRERMVGEWGELFKRTDERFEVSGVRVGEGGFFVTVEAVWRG